MYLERVLEASETAELSDYSLEHGLLDGFALFEPLVEDRNDGGFGMSGSRDANGQSVWWL